MYSMNLADWFVSLAFTYCETDDITSGESYNALTSMRPPSVLHNIFLDHDADERVREMEGSGGSVRGRAPCLRQHAEPIGEGVADLHHHLRSPAGRASLRVRGRRVGRGRGPRAGTRARAGHGSPAVSGSKGEAPRLA